MPTFHFHAVPEHGEVPLADHGKLEQTIEHADAVAAHALPPASDSRTNKADYIVAVSRNRDANARAAQLSEMVSLVENQGDRVVGSELVLLSNPNPKTLLGPGQAQAVADRARAVGAQMLVVDAELSPSQTRNLEDVVKLPVCDREAIILNVFRLRARTQQARVQIELAQLEYLRPRIRGVGLDMDQQTGGMPGARGPGETASELLARKLDDRITELRRVTQRLAVAAQTQRARSTTSRRIALVGYTNAGKTSLMNALSGAALAACDRPFETLDITSRCLTRHGGDVLLTDTVGFIRTMPARLLASFYSSLDVVREASLLAIVVDASDPEHPMHLATVESVLQHVGASAIPRVYIANKVDRLPIGAATNLAAFPAAQPAIAVSSRNPNDIASLRDLLLQHARSDERTVWLNVPYSADAALALIYARCRVLQTFAKERGVALQVCAAAPVIAQVRTALAKEQV
jgi:GTP-binding protein HflX